MSEEQLPPVVEAAQAIAQTIANPSIPVLAEDLLLAHKLVNEVKEKLAGKHPSLSVIFNTLFNLS